MVPAHLAAVFGASIAATASEAKDGSYASEGAGGASSTPRNNFGCRHRHTSNSMRDECRWSERRRFAIAYGLDNFRDEIISSHCDNLKICGHRPVGRADAGLPILVPTFSVCECAIE